MLCLANGFGSNIGCVLHQSLPSAAEGTWGGFNKPSYGRPGSSDSVRGGSYLLNASRDLRRRQTATMNPSRLTNR